jgi:hypothetical protein
MTAFPAGVERAPIASSEYGERLLGYCAELCNWWSEFGAMDECPYEALGFRLHELRSLIAEYLSRPEVGRSAALMKTADAVLLSELDMLIARLRVCQPGMDCWAEAHRATTTFVRKLRSRIQSDTTSRAEEAHS